MTVTCPRCRHDNPAETKFCGHCAAPLDSSALPTETMQTPVRELTTGSLFAGRYQVIEELVAAAWAVSTRSTTPSSTRRSP